MLVDGFRSSPTMPSTNTRAARGSFRQRPLTLSGAQHPRRQSFNVSRWIRNLITEQAQNAQPRRWCWAGPGSVQQRCINTHRENCPRQKHHPKRFDTYLPRLMLCFWIDCPVTGIAPGKPTQIQRVDRFANLTHSHRNSPCPSRPAPVPPPSHKKADRETGNPDILHHHTPFPCPPQPFHERRAGDYALR